MNSFSCLTALTLVQLLGGTVVIGLGEQQKLARKLTLTFSLLALGLTLFLWSRFDAASGSDPGS